MNTTDNSTERTAQKTDKATTVTMSEKLPKTLSSFSELKIVNQRTERVSLPVEADVSFVLKTLEPQTRWEKDKDKKRRNTGEPDVDEDNRLRCLLHFEQSEGKFSFRCFRRLSLDEYNRFVSLVGTAVRLSGLTVSSTAEKVRDSASGFDRWEQRVYFDFEDMDVVS